MEDLSVLSELRGKNKSPCLLFVIIISEPPAVLFSCTGAVNGGVTLPAIFRIKGSLSSMFVVHICVW